MIKTGIYHIETAMDSVKQLGETIEELSKNFATSLMKGANDIWQSLNRLVCSSSFPCLFANKVTKQMADDKKVRSENHHY